MKLPYRPALAAIAPLALAACGSDNKEADQRTAVGEILPGSASDAMLPYDQARSQNPLAPKPDASSSASDEAEAEAGEDAAPDAETGSAPVGETADGAEPAAE